MTNRLQTTAIVRVRVKVAVWPDGRWTAYGDQTQAMERTMDELIEACPPGESTHWVEATLPMPVTVEGEVI